MNFLRNGGPAGRVAAGLCCAAGAMAFAGQAAAIEWDGNFANDGEYDGFYTDDVNWVGDKTPDPKEPVTFAVTKAYTVVLDQQGIAALSTSINAGEVTFVSGGSNGDTGWQPGGLFISGLDTLAFFNGLDFDMSSPQGSFQISNGAEAGLEDVSGQMLNFTVGDTSSPSAQATLDGADLTLIPNSASASGAFNVVGQVGDGGSTATLRGNSSVDANISGIGITDGSRGTLEILQSSEFTADTMLIGFREGRGDVSVSGTGSRLTVGGTGGGKNLFLGSSLETGSGSGSLTLDAGGTADVTASLFANFNSLVDNRQGTLTVADQAQFSGQFRQGGNNTSTTRFDGDAVFNKTGSYAQTGGVVRFVGAADFSESDSFSQTGGEIAFEGGAAFGQTTIALGDPDANETARWEVSSDVAFARALRVGDTAGTRGGVTVSSGGVLRNTSGGGAADLVIGLNGRGELAVTGTGRVDAYDDLVVGSNVGSEGLVTLTDQAEVFVNRNGSGSNLFVGLNGFGQLEMDGNSRLIVGNNVVVGANDPGLEVTSQLSVGSNNSNTPSDAQLSVGGDLIVGPGFPGTPSGQLLFRDGAVAVQNGGLVTVADTVHLQEGGRLSIGPNGQLITRNLISDPGSSGLSSILGELTIDGGVAEINSSSAIGISGSGDYDSVLRAVNGGVIRASGLFRIRGSVNGVSGTVEAVGIGSRIEKSLGSDGVISLTGGNSVLRIADGASAAMNQIKMFGPGTPSSLTLIDVVGGTGGVASRLDLGDETTPGSIIFNESFFLPDFTPIESLGGGTVRVRDGGVLDLWGGTMSMEPNYPGSNEQGRVTEFIVTGSGSAGASTARLGQFRITDSSAVARIEQGGRLFTSISTYLLDSSLVVDGGELYTPLLWTQGTTSQFELLGDGVLETAEVRSSLDLQGGFLRPGSGTGSDDIADQISDLNINALSSYTYTQGAAATLEIQIGGTTAGTEHDRLLGNSVTLQAGTGLDVQLVSGFMPTVGDSFEIVVADEIFGTFGRTTGLDLADGLRLEVAYTLDRITLNVVAALLAGDYNGNGTVDAADYTVWADNFGSMTLLAADGNGNGTVDAADYTIWADNFGASSAAALGLTNIPEPGTLALLGLGFPALMRRRRAAA